MNDQPAQPPYVYDGLDPVPEPKSAISEVSDAVMGAANRVSEAIESGRKPGMPLSISPISPAKRRSARCS